MSPALCKGKSTDGEPSSSKIIKRLRQQRYDMLAGIKHIQTQLKMHRQSIADLEPMVLGDQGDLSRSPRSVKAKVQMETLKVVPSPNG